jgi:hypothetical protein|nr:MAG TPA: hypothetical protein [Caudoviricetes sp.]
MNCNVSVDEMVVDIMDSKRLLIVEEAVDEYLLAERDIMIEATTAADKMADLSIDAGYDDDSQFLEDDEEVNAFVDSVITDDIEGEEDIFQDTIDECDEDDDMIEDIEDVLTDYEDLDELLEDDDIDSLIYGDEDYDY